MDDLLATHRDFVKRRLTEILKKELPGSIPAKVRANAGNNVIDI